MIWGVSGTPLACSIPVLAEVPCPLVLPALPVMAVPDLFKRRVWPQVINVPVGAAGKFQMIREPATDASGAVGAADIDVESRLQPQFPKPSDADEPVRSRRKHQSVCSRSGFYRCQHEPHPCEQTLPRSVTAHTSPNAMHTGQRVCGRSGIRLFISEQPEVDHFSRYISSLLMLPWSVRA
jgi:hypothetical protein